MKKIIIVGASSGIGRCVAQEYIDDGNWMVGVAARRIKLLDELKNLAPERVKAISIDVTSADAEIRLQELIAETGGMDIFMLASGVGHQNPMLNADAENNTIDTNVKGFTTMIDAAYKYFHENGKIGHIAAITSIAGTRGLGVAASYSASKRYQWCYLDAIEQLAHMQQVKLSITDLRPGFVKTDLLADGKHYPFMLSAEYTAKAIKRAIEKRKRIKIINLAYAILVFFWRLIPRFVWRIMPVKN
mgnify:CR=1 FL=1